MGLNASSTPFLFSKEEKDLKIDKNYKTIALAGNPNVGKSTVFNALTGMHQHTGNWPGKTVSNARGVFKHKDEDFVLVDIPGTYSLNSSSKEEEVARDFICFAEPDCTVVVVDATCLERNLNLVLQVLEATTNVVVCVNLLDEAKKKDIIIDLDELSLQLGVPVVGTSARSGKGLDELKNKIYDVVFKKIKTFKIKLSYEEGIEKAINELENELNKIIDKNLNIRWLATKLLDFDKSFYNSLCEYLGFDLLNEQGLNKKINEIKEDLNSKNISSEGLRDSIVSSIFKRSEKIYNLCVSLKNKTYNNFDRKLDKILTSKSTGIPVMLLILGFIFWLTISGANYPSEVLANVLFNCKDYLESFLNFLHSPSWLTGLICDGLYKTVAWVVSVMLPPMAIFFPLFTIMEDSGYLPRVAFNLDGYFKKAGAHGKQSLTMCMGFGCNACGVMGCRIIDSARERLIAILTNSFVPCNGRFPTLIAITSMFFVGFVAFPFNSILGALFLVFVISMCTVMTLLVSKFLSKTFLKGIPSSFILELPPYRKPQIGKVIVRSIFDRTLFVLARALIVAAPAGLIIWFMSNISINNISILSYCSNFLDPFARLLGLDGVILLAFILGFPANEIVIPIILMAYLCTGSITDYTSLFELKNIFISHGWTLSTAICFIIFSLFHFPCGTTCLTIQKETGSFKWTALAFLLPLAVGIVLCFITSSIFSLINLV